MSNRSLNDEIKRLCKANDCPQPLEFLLSAMAGDDRRRDLSSVYQLAERIRARGADVDESVSVLVDEILSNEIYRYNRIDVRDSINVGKEILQYQYPKKRENKIELDARATVKIGPMTDDEIEQFNDLFSGDF